MNDDAAIEKGNYTDIYTLNFPALRKRTQKRFY